MPSIANSNAATKQEIRDVCAITTFVNFTANSGTPSVAFGGSFKTLNSLATTISNFTGGYNGQVIRVVINDANTTIDFTGSSLIGNGGIDWEPVVGDSFTAVRDNAGYWFCQLGTGIGAVGDFIAKNIDDTSTGKLTIEGGGAASTYQLGGINQNATAGSIGVYGQALANTGVALRGFTTGQSSTAVLAETTGSGAIGGNFRSVLGAGFSYGIKSYVGSSDGIAGYFQNVTDSTDLSLSTGTALITGEVNAAEVFNVDKTGKVTASGGIDKLTTSTGTITIAASAAPSTGQFLVAATPSIAYWATLVEAHISDLGDYATVSEVALKADITYVDTHIADTTVHYLQSEISITKSQITDFGNWLIANNGAYFTNEPITAIGAIAIGEAAEAADQDSIAFGNGAYAGSQGDIAIGYNAQAYSDFTGINPPHNIAIGDEALAIGDEGSLALGTAVVVSASNAIGIGRYLNVRDDNEIRMGNSESTEISILDGKIVVYEASEEVFRIQTAYKTDTGATEITTYSLPAAVKGMKYVFERVSAYAYRIDPNGIEYFAGSTAGLYKSLDAIGTYMSIECFKTGIWHIIALLGTVSDE